MPSVHDNEISFWEVQRVSNAFQCDLQNVMQNKVQESPVITSSVSSSSVKNVIQYSISTNGYYGYHPHLVRAASANNDTCEHTNEDHAMDVDDNYNECEHLASGNKSIDYNIDRTLFHNFSRKRHLPGNTENILKRMRQGEPAETELKLPTHVNHRNVYTVECFACPTGCDGVGDASIKRTLSSRNNLDSNNSANDLDATTVLLLKNTHGCEMFLFERTCDY